MIIKLISLSLNNFKGIDYFEFLPDGKSSSVFGTNGSGKTTLADAYFWLLFGKDSSGAANFDVKTIGTSGLDYSVTAKIEIDGNAHILTRTLNEKWERKHGETEKRLKGNTTTYEIDGVPVKEKDFKAFIENELINEKTYQMLTDPDFFAGKTDWKKRRSQLIEWFADVSDEDIISSHSEFKELSEILDGKTIENAQKSIQAGRKAVNDLLKAIPNRIDEQQRNINEITSAINGDEQENLDRLLKEKTTVENDIIKASTSESLNRAKAAVEEIKLKIVRARKAYEESNNADRSTEQQILTLRKEKFKLQSKAADNNQNLKLLEKRLSDITDQGKGYNEEFKRISAQEYEESNICPCCGQLLSKYGPTSTEMQKAEMTDDKGKTTTQEIKDNANKQMIDVQIDEETEEVIQKNQILSRPQEPVQEPLPFDFDD